MNSVPAPPHAPPYVIPWNALSLDKKLGEGGFGVVFRARWKHENVAVKQMKDGMQGAHERELFVKELQLLQSIKHNRVVQFMGGGCEADGPCFIVTEYMQHGSLLDCLSR